MNFLIFSDSHGRSDNINEVLDRAGKYDGVFFLGDGLRDLMYCDFSGRPVYSVRGNCDFSGFYGDVSADRYKILDICSKRIFLTHGHEFDVKHGLDRIIYAAQERDIDIVIFGHTHKKLEMRLTPESIPTLKKPLCLFNPGSIGSHEASFGRLDINSRGEVLFSHGEL